MQASHGPDPSDFSAAQDASLQAGIRNGIAQGNAAGRAAADAARAGGAGTSDEFKFWGKTIEQHAADVVTFFIADPLECILGNECGVGGAALAAASFGRLGKLARASMEVEDALLVGQVARRARLTQEAVEHIALRHFPTSGATNAGKFATTSLREIRALISETVERGAIRPNTLGRPGNIFELTFGRQIGTNAAGEAATSLRVVVTPEGLVTTAFPF
jgi:hypothetical protein